MASGDIVIDKLWSGKISSADFITCINSINHASVSNSWLFIIPTGADGAVSVVSAERTN